MDFIEKTEHKGRPVQVVAGFDPVLHRFFMIVEPLEDDNPNANEESGLIYTNLDDEKALPELIERDPQYYRGKLKELEIDVPNNFFDKVYAGND